VFGFVEIIGLHVPERIVLFVIGTVRSGQIAEGILLLHVFDVAVEECDVGPVEMSVERWHELAGRAVLSKVMAVFIPEVEIVGALLLRPDVAAVDEQRRISPVLMRVSAFVLGPSSAQAMCCRESRPQSVTL